MVGARHTLMAIRALQTPKKNKGYCVRPAPHSLLLPSKYALLFTAVALTIKIHKLLHWSPFHCQVSESAVGESLPVTHTYQTIDDIWRNIANTKCKPILKEWQLNCP